MNAAVITVLFAPIIVTAAAILYFRNINRTFIKLLLAFSGAFLFSLSLLHLIPELYKSLHFNAGIFILLGFFLQILLEFFSHGIEHGHAHAQKNAGGKLPVIMIASLCIHSFVEAMPVTYGVHSHGDDPVVHASWASFTRSLLLGIVLHNIPITIVLVSTLLASNIRQSLIWLAVLLFAVSAPAGAAASYLIGSDLSAVSAFFDRILAVVIGIFLHISTTILFESSENHRFNLLKFATILAGAAVAWASL